MTSNYIFKIFIRKINYLFNKYIHLFRNQKKKIMKKLLLFSVVLAFWTVSNAQNAGELNPNFGTNGIFQFAPTNSFDEPNALLLQPDEKILTIGRARKDNTRYNIYMSRHLADGSLDNSFGTDGIKIMLPFPEYDNDVFDAKLLDDGKILICGYLFGGANNWMPFLLKLNSDGSYDTNFGEGGYISHQYEAVAITETMSLQQDGKIVTAGYISNPSDKAIVMRYNENGQLDNSFGTNGHVIFEAPSSFSTNAVTSAIQADGKIVVAGFAIDNTNSDNKGFVTRLNTDGTIDTEFGENGFFTADMGLGHDFTVDLKIHSDGKIFVGGHSWIRNTPILQYDFCVLRLNSNGKLDQTYGNNGIASIRHKDGGNYSRNFAISETGSVYAVSDYIDELSNVRDITIFSFDSNGVANNSFGENGIVSLDINERQDEVRNVEILKDGTLLICGRTFPSYTHSDIILANYFTDIEIDIQENHISKSVDIYPNPTTDLLKFSENISEDLYNVKVYNSVGSVILEQNLNLPTENLDVRSLPKGNYVIKLTNGSEILTNKFIKQ